jgi:serine/threonine protein kinase
VFDYCIDILKKQLGKGGYGEVFLCEHKYTQYAIKRMDTKSFKEQIAKENEMFNLKINNPFIVKYYHTFEEGNFKYFVMEYCKDGNLEQLIKNRREKNISFTEEVLFIIFLNFI